MVKKEEQLELALKKKKKSKSSNAIKQYSIEYCLEQIKKEVCLWDMRYWNKYHDKEEVKKWCNEIVRAKGNEFKNCGHTTLCIYLLFTTHKYNKHKIVDAILSNDKIMYKGYSKKICKECSRKKWNKDCDNCKHQKGEKKNDKD